MNSVFKADALKFIDKLSDDSIDLICVDPPYNMKKDSWDTFPSDREFLEFTYKWIESATKKLV